MRRLIAAAAATAALAAFAATAAATIVLRVTPRELADTAGLVVEGRVSAVDVRWDDARTCINTYVTFTVERTHKGTAAGSVTVKVPGGKVGDEEVRVEGTAKFERDEEALLFLWKDREGDWLVLGETQGKFRLWQDEKAGKRMAGNSLKGLCLVVRGDPKGAGAETARRPDTLSYDDLVAVVKASVAEAKPAPATTAPTAPAAQPAGGATTAPNQPAPNQSAPNPPAPNQPAPSQPVGGTTTTQPAGRDPAPPVTTPDPPSTKDAPRDGAPPPPKDAPAPQAGASGTPGAGQLPPPAPEKK